MRSVDSILILAGMACLAFMLLFLRLTELQAEVIFRIQKNNVVWETKDYQLDRDQIIFKDSNGKLRRIQEPFELEMVKQ